jgi:pimeloyl-ACP methyl ester carboxylesterase
MPIEIRDVRANGFTFRCRLSGSAGEPIILLHGFPETSDAWSELMNRLPRGRYRCLAPDQRGYSPGARPLEVDQYSLDRIAADVIALADELGFQRFHLIGHDWGAAAGWTVVRDHAERVGSWTALSVPHVASYGAGFDHPEQRDRAAYIKEFLEPGKGEEELSRNGFERLHRAWSQYCPEKTHEYESVFSQPGALTAALNWYRATFGDTSRRQRAFAGFDVHTPTLTLWGNGDPSVARPATLMEKDFMKGPYRFVELDAGHWLMHERPDDCIREITAHLSAHPC